MTSKDIKTVQILAATKDGEYIIASSNNQALIDLIATMCVFRKIKKEYVEELSIKEYLTDD